MMPALNYIFNISILIGFVIPLLNLLTGWFGSFLGVGADIDFDASPDVGAGVDADAGLGVSAGAGVDIGADISADTGVGAGAETNIGNNAVVPFNVMCLCLFLVVFGALGHVAKLFMYNTLLVILLLLSCLVIAALAYWALYTLLIKRLKDNDASATSYRDLRGKKAEVTLVIKADSIGTISIKDNIGAAISFRAKIDPDLKSQMPDSIAAGDTVIITDIDKKDKLCYVSVPFHKFTNTGGKK